MGIGNPFKGLEKEIKKGLNKLGDEIKSGVKKVGREIESSVKSAGNKAEGTIRSVADKAEHAVKDIAHEAEESIQKAGKAALEEIEDAAEEAFEVAQAAARATLKELSSGTLNKLVDGMQILMPSATELTLGPFVLSVDDWTDRVDTLQKWASNPPSSKDDIKAIIVEVAPSAVGINLSFSLAFLFVQSDSLEFGVANTYETVDFLDKFDALLSHYGINI